MGGGSGNGLFDTGGAGNNFLSSRALFGGVFDNSEQQSLDAARDARDTYNGIPIPKLQWNTYVPQNYQAQLAQANQVQDDPLAKSAQMSALAKMGDLSNTGLSAVDQQGYEQARELGNQMANSGSQAAMQNAANRGLAGSGMEFAQREQANQAGAGRAQQAALQQAADSARQRAMYNQAYLSGMSNLRAQDTNLNAQNAGILNQFNMANTNAQNQAHQWNAQNQNQAQVLNNQGRMNAQQQMFQDQLGRAGGIASGDQGVKSAYAAANAANTAGRNQDFANFTTIMKMAGGGGGAPSMNGSGPYNGMQTAGGDENMMGNRA